MRRMLLASLTLALAACSNSPKPPVVDGSNRQTINDSATVELLALRAQVAEARKLVAQAEQAPSTESTVFRYQFSFSSSKLALTPAQKAELLLKAHSAERIEIRGRTDGKRPSSGDEAVAKARALAARSLLVANGVPPEKMAINYVSAADYVADNYSPAGRSQNRRVEIEVFQQAKGE